MTRKLIKRLCPLLCLLLLPALSGCGESLDSALLANRCARAVEAAGGLGFDAALTGEASYRGVPFTLDAVGSGAWTADPFGLHTQFVLYLSDLAHLEGELLLAPDGDGLCAFLGLRPEEETVWIRLPISLSLPSLTEAPGVLGLLTEGREEGDSPCLRLRIPGELIREGAEDLPITLWLDGETLLPSFLEADLTGAVQALLDQNGRPALRELSVRRLTLELAFTGPEEAQMQRAFTADGAVWTA